jgi:hypothetical protein
VVGEFVTSSRNSTILPRGKNDSVLSRELQPATSANQLSNTNAPVVFKYRGWDSGMALPLPLDFCGGDATRVGWN